MGRVGHLLADGLVRLVLVPVLLLTRTRVYRANLHRIGDTLIDVGFYVKASRLGWRTERRAIVIPPPRTRTPANPSALSQLGRHVRISNGRWTYPLLFRCSVDERVGGTLFGDLPLRDGRRIDQYLFAMAVQREWEETGHGPLLDLDPADEARGREALRRAGVDADWFVCLHVREAGFLREPSTSGHRHLNADVTTYLPAAEWIVRQGGAIVRMGDPSMRRLPAAEGLFDYAHSDLKADWMDVYLASACRFWLGTNSGLFMLASSFGVPVALTNVAPAIFRPWSSGDLFIPKLYESPDRGRLLTLAESLAPELYTSHDIDTQGVHPVDNEPAEILELAREMLERLEGRRADSPADEERQERFRRLQPSYYPVPMLCRVGADFLARHEDLLDE